MRRNLRGQRIAVVVNRAGRADRRHAIGRGGQLRIAVGAGEAANERYLDALAEVDVEKPLGERVEGLCCPVKWNGKRVRLPKRSLKRHK